MAVTREFREFIARGNVIDLAVGVIIGAAFGKIVTTLVEGIIMPPVGLALGRIDFSSLFYVLDSAKGVPASLADAKAKGIPVIAFLSHVQTDLAAAAREAGCDILLARSAFVRELPQLMERFAGAGSPRG